MFIFYKKVSYSIASLVETYLSIVSASKCDRSKGSEAYIHLFCLCRFLLRISGGATVGVPSLLSSAVVLAVYHLPTPSEGLSVSSASVFFALDKLLWVALRLLVLISELPTPA